MVIDMEVEAGDQVTRVERKEIAISVEDLDIDRSSVMRLPTRMEIRLQIPANHRRRSTRYLTRMVREERLMHHHLVKID